MSLYRPKVLDQALGFLAEGPAALVAGGTDVFPALGLGPAPARVVDLTAVEGLRGISRAGDGWRIGAATTWTDVVRADLPPLFDALKQAARQVGSVQIQNTGTVAGNICNASPAADGVPVLIASIALAWSLVGSMGGRVFRRPVFRPICAVAAVAVSVVALFNTTIGFAGAALLIFAVYSLSAGQKASCVGQGLSGRP